VPPFKTAADVSEASSADLTDAARRDVESLLKLMPVRRRAMRSGGAGPLRLGFFGAQRLHVDLLRTASAGCRA